MQHLLHRQRQRARDRLDRVSQVGGREREHFDPGQDVELHQPAVQAETKPAAKLPLPPLQEEGGDDLVPSLQEVEGGPVVPSHSLSTDLTDGQTKTVRTIYNLPFLSVTLPTPDHDAKPKSGAKSVKNRGNEFSCRFTGQQQAQQVAGECTNAHLYKKKFCGRSCSNIYLHIFPTQAVYFASYDLSQTIFLCIPWSHKYDCIIIP